MGIQSFFHKIKMGIVRAGASSIPRPSEAKRYGNCGEDVFVDMLRRELPDCELKRNVVISTPDGNAEIDCLGQLRLDFINVSLGQALASNSPPDWQAICQGWFHHPFRRGEH